MSGSRLPEARYTIAIQGTVIAYNGNVLGESLGDQHAVERVSMWAREQPGSKTMFRTHWDNTKPFAIQVKKKVFDYFHFNIEFAEPCLSGNFPD